MIKVAATEFIKNFEQFPKETVAITDHDHAIGYLISESDYRDYLLLKAKEKGVQTNRQAH